MVRYLRPNDHIGDIKLVSEIVYFRRPVYFYQRKDLTMYYISKDPIEIGTLFYTSLDKLYSGEEIPDTSEYIYFVDIITRYETINEVAVMAKECMNVSIYTK